MASAMLAAVREPAGSTATWVGLGVLAAFGIGGAIWWFGGGSDWFLEGDFERFVREAGPAGPVVFVGSMWLVQPLGLPGTLWMVPAGVVWPWPVAVALAWVGNMGASTIAFVFARVVGRAWVSPRLPPQIRAFDERRFANGGTGMVVLLRILTGQLAPADWLLGVSRIRNRTFLIGTGIGILPGIVMAVVGGPAVLTWFSALPLAVQVGAAVVVVVTAGLVALRRRRVGGGWLVRWATGSSRSRSEVPTGEGTPGHDSSPL